MLKLKGILTQYVSIKKKDIKNTKRKIHRGERGCASVGLCYLLRSQCQPGTRPRVDLPLAPSEAMCLG